MVVIQGQYTILIESKKILLHPGDEYLIPKGVIHSGEAIAGTRAIYAFGGKRVKREVENQ
jgi:quercetin dioxygenase-like cupin family protein